MTLHVPSFGGGVVIAGAPGQRKIDEILEADSFEIGVRGALVAASDVTDYTSFLDGDTVPALWTALRGLLAVFPGFDQTKVLAVGEGRGLRAALSPIGPAYLMREFARTGAPVPVPPPVFPLAMTMDTSAAVAAPTVPAVEGVIVTGCNWPGVWKLPGPSLPINIALVCLGARERFSPRSNAAFGLYVATVTVGSGLLTAVAIKQFNALGTGPLGDGTGADTGTLSQQLYFRGIIGYNNHVFGWGFDSADTTNGDGPNRVMFCNLGKPLKWGNDNIASAGDRLFTDSDAIVLGDAGEIIRGAIKLFGKLFFGTNAGLHFIAGYGRDSFLTDGSTPVMKAYNIVGPHALIEGPDKLMYGVADAGLWNFDGAGIPDPLFQKLVDYAGHSNGWWDLIWTDPTRAPGGVPGITNQDLVWTAVDWDRRQVLVGIPWCNADAGAGVGEDTVVIKYHVLTGGFTRQVFRGVQFDAAAYSRRQGQTPEIRFMGTGTVGQAQVQRYGYKVNASSSPVMPTILPTAAFGPYAPFSPDGRGSLGRLYLTVAWETAASLPIVLRISTDWDGRQSDDNLLTISAAAPALPATDDLWLDTSLTDINVGNGLAGSIIASFPVYLFKRWTGTAWQQMPGLGVNGARATVRFPMDPRNGTLVTMRVETVSAAGRFQLESLGEKPSGGSSAA